MPIANSPLPWTGDYLDGFYNKITMFAYANPAFNKISEMAKQQRNPEAFLGDGYGLVRFNKKTRETTFECWPRYADVSKGDSEQFPGWPMTFKMEDNDGRTCMPQGPTPSKSAPANRMPLSPKILRQ